MSSQGAGYQTERRKRERLPDDILTAFFNATREATMVATDNKHRLEMHELACNEQNRTLAKVMDSMSQSVIDLNNKITTATYWLLGGCIGVIGVLIMVIWNGLNR